MKQKKSYKNINNVNRKKRKLFIQTKTYKNKIKKKYKKRADVKYYNSILKSANQLYNVKKFPLKIVMKYIEKEYISNTKKRLVKTKRKYIGESKWTKDKNGIWKKGRKIKRYQYRDRLFGKYSSGMATSKNFLKIMEKDLIRNYMKKKKIKNYNKAKSKFRKLSKKSSFRKIIQLYGGSP